MKQVLAKLIWLGIAVLGAAGLGVLALSRGEPISAGWLIVAGVCSYLVAYRFYSRYLAFTVFGLDDQRATPAERLNNGRDFVPTNKWVAAGHHFSAISGAGPLVGPTLAAQFGYLPGTIWLIAGVVLGGAVQDMIVLCASVRRDGKSLGQMAKEEVNAIAGFTAMVAMFAIMTILLAVLSLVVVNALRDSPWGLCTIAATIPIALLMGIWMHHVRPGKVAEATAIGIVLPLAPRDYLSAFMKIGTILVLGTAILILMPPLKMPPFTQFIDGTGPVFAGKLFPFAFTTIACGAISGFHALVASGTTPKMVMRETDARLIGYGAMLTESLVALMAMSAAATLDPGVYFAMNVGPAVLGTTAESAAQAIAQWGFVLRPEQMDQLARQMGEALGHVYKPLGQYSWYPSIVLSSGIVVAAWGYFLYQGVTDPQGGIQALWPLFGIANQLLAAVALCVATTILIKMGKLKHAWTTMLPLIWLTAATLTAGYQKVFSDSPALGFLAHARSLANSAAPNAARMIFNDRVDAALALFFMIIVIVVIVACAREWVAVATLRKPSVVHEAPYVKTQITG